MILMRPRSARIHRLRRTFADEAVAVAVVASVGTRFAKLSLTVSQLETYVYRAGVCRGCIMLLIVEDEAVSRRALSQILRLHGHQTQVAGSGEEAIALLRDGDVPEAAIVDIDLPGMSGVEFVRHLTRDHPDVRCVFMTANDEVNLDHLRFTSRQSALRKPFDIDHLLQLIDDFEQRAPAPIHN